MITSWSNLPRPIPCLFQLPIRFYHEKNAPICWCPLFHYTVKYFPLPLMITTVRETDAEGKTTHPCGGDVTHSALILHRGTSIVIQEASPIFPGWSMGCAQAFSDSREKNVVFWSYKPKQMLGSQAHLQRKAPGSCHSKVETKPRHSVTNSVLRHVFLMRHKPSSPMELWWRNWSFPTIEPLLHLNS